VHASGYGRPIPSCAGAAPLPLTDSPFHSPTRQRQAEETRRRILDAVRALYREAGYAGTTLDVIAGERR
jgi:hypothetical protein